jgi:NAD(P)-dependent dehydrogenase (short-subunit alcohol dehydrogenase family)
VLVTGGSGGIGHDIVKRFAADGAHVINLDRAAPRRKAGHDARVDFVSVDFADASAVAPAFEQADRLWRGRAPDVLVCGAAIGMTHHLLEVKPQDIDRILAINVRGTLQCCQEAARRMHAQGAHRAVAGRIVVITSLAAVTAWAQEPLYGISKAAQLGLVQALAIELAPLNIVVNAVGPGIVQVKSKGMSGNRSRPEIVQHYLDAIPLRRMAEPREIADAIAYLARATYATGQTLYVDGGFLASGLAYIGSLREDVMSRLSRGGVAP